MLYLYIKGLYISIFTDYVPYQDLRTLVAQIIDLMEWLEQNWPNYYTAQIIADANDITDEVNSLFFEGSDSGHAERFMDARGDEEADIEEKQRYSKDLEYYRAELTKIKDSITGETTTFEKKKYVMTFESFISKTQKKK